jgi:hypothetical protein
MRPTRRAISSWANDSAEGIGDQLEQVEVNDEHGGRLLRAVRRQNGLFDSIVEQHVIAQSRGVIGQRQQLLIGADLRHVVENGNPEPVAMPLERAQRGLEMDALAIVTARDQRADRPVASAKQPWLISVGDVEQAAERRADEVGGGVAEHLPKRAIARPNASVAVHHQDRRGALLRQRRHDGRRVGVARDGGGAVRSRCQPGQRAQD